MEQGSKMECEVCGRQIYGRAHKVIIDGAKLLVCSECTQFTPSRWRYDSNTQQTATRPRPPRRQSKPRPRQELIADNFVLINGYGNRIRKARESLGLTHKEFSRKIGEKISLLQKIETEKMIPDTILIKKLEHALKIKLRDTESVQLVEEIPGKKPTDLTLGDVVVVQRGKER